mmetsp:Transcript_11930/g.36365  ORF Transcript_11930/g.36365 Transcript_11930/m.36365 type:complete len:498 (+) Transcript_11930:225-1718(+)
MAELGVRDSMYRFLDEAAIIYDEKSDLFSEAFRATWNALVLWWQLIAPLIVLLGRAIKEGAVLTVHALAPSWPYVVKAFHIIRRQSIYSIIKSWPHLKILAKRLIRGLLHADPKTLMTTAAFIGSVALLTTGLRRLQKLQRGKKAAGKERVARTGALLLSYLVLSIILFLPDVIFLEDIIPTTVLVHIPIYLTLHTLSDLGQDVFYINHWLCYWSVYSTFDMFWRFPVLGRVIRRTPLIGKIRLFAGIWMSVPRFGGAELLFWALMPIVNTHFRKISKHNISAQGNTLLRFLKMTGTLSPERATDLAVALADPGSLVALAAIFLVTPDRVTKGACMFVELVYPVYASMYSYVNENVPLKTKWLRYWFVSRVCILILDQFSAFTMWIPLWSRIELFFVIWLQLPYFNGAQKLYVKIAAGVTALKKLLYRAVGQVSSRQSRAVLQEAEEIEEEQLARTQQHIKEEEIVEEIPTETLASQPRMMTRRRKKLMQENVKKTD